MTRPVEIIQTDKKGREKVIEPALLTDALINMGYYGPSNQLILIESMLAGETVTGRECTMWLRPIGGQNAR